jgi:hypothetical protein
MTDQLRNFSITVWIVVSVVYIASYSLVSGFIAPLQFMLLPELSKNIGLLFLPHGVKVITFYFFGLWGYVYLMPAVALMWAIEVYGNEQNLLFSGAIASLISCHLGVICAKWLNSSGASRDSVKLSWRDLIVAGAIGSIFNSLVQTWLYGSMVIVISLVGYFIGDVAGQFILMLIVIAFARLARIVAKLS